MAKTNIIQKLDDLLHDEHYSRSNIIHYDYTEDTLRQWLKNHWEYLDVQKDRDDDLKVIWIDIHSALDNLPEPERSVTEAYAIGYRDKALIEYTGHENASTLVTRGVVKMVSVLKGK